MMSSAIRQGWQKLDDLQLDILCIIQYINEKKALLWLRAAGIYGSYYKNHGATQSQLAAALFGQLGKVGRLIAMRSYSAETDS
eukprot:scaffold125622_cov18-Prasinocladus_malaysianus.AAC.2